MTGLKEVMTMSAGGGTDRQEESGTALTSGGGWVGLRWVDKRNNRLVKTTLRPKVISD